MNKEFKDQMMISVIVSTFNRPRALNIILKSLVNQTDKNFEIVVADDGSDVRTREVINKVKQNFPRCPIKHIWQEDRGFRLARIRNLAVKASIGEYLIFLDGDCIPPPNFIQDHRYLSEQGWAVYGQRILLSEKYTRDLENKSDEILNEGFWRFKNFFILYLRKKINRILPIFKLLNHAWRKRSPCQWGSIRGCNWAMWRDSYLQINGSDESFEGWGGEDKDVAVRLINSKIFLKDGRYYSFVLHLWHPIANRENNQKQSEIVMSRFKNKITTPKKGIY